MYAGLILRAGWYLCTYKSHHVTVILLQLSAYIIGAVPRYNRGRLYTNSWFLAIILVYLQRISSPLISLHPSCISTRCQLVGLQTTSSAGGRLKFPHQLTRHRIRLANDAWKLCLPWRGTFVPWIFSIHAHTNLAKITEIWNSFGKPGHRATTHVGWWFLPLIS